MPKILAQERNHHIHTEEIVDVVVEQKVEEIVRVPKVQQQERIVQNQVEIEAEVPRHHFRNDHRGAAHPERGECRQGAGGDTDRRQHGCAKPGADYRSGEAEDRREARAEEEADHPNLEFTSEQMRGIIDTTIQELQRSARWKHMSTETLAALTSDIKSNYPDEEGRLYSQVDALELMKFTGKRCGEELKLKVANAASGDYVRLRGLDDDKLNAAVGTVLECLPDGKLRVDLGWRMLFRIVAVSPENLLVVETAGNIAAVRKLRDEGISVSSLVARGYSICAIQRDDSDNICKECYRSRYMCSCTFLLKDP